MQTALIQQKYYETKTQTLDVTVKNIKEAAQKGAELIVLQELHQTEYFCQSEDTNFFAYANDYEQDISFWSDIARENNIVLVTSLLKNVQRGSTITQP